jgi:hypothetical protein
MRGPHWVHPVTNITVHLMKWEWNENDYHCERSGPGTRGADTAALAH